MSNDNSIKQLVKEHKLLSKHIRGGLVRWPTETHLDLRKIQDEADNRLVEHGAGLLSDASDHIKHLFLKYNPVSLVLKKLHAGLKHDLGRK